MPHIVDFRSLPNSPTFWRPYGPPAPWPEDRPATWVPLPYGRAALTPYEMSADSTVLIAPHGQYAQAERKVIGTYGGQSALAEATASAMGLGDWTEADAEALAKASLDLKAKPGDATLLDTTRRLRAQRAAHFASASRSWFVGIPTGLQVAIVAIGGLIALRLTSAFKG